MDNTAGANGGVFSSGSEQDSAKVAGATSNFDSLNPNSNADFDNYVKQRADLAPQSTEAMQMPPMPMGGEVSPDMIDMMPGASEAAPEAGEANGETEDGKPKGYESEAVVEERKKKAKAEAEAAERRERLPELEVINSINVPRDSSKIPKDYMKTIAAGIEHHSNDPATLSEFVDEARWDYMSKAFGRGLGDGLNGDGKAGK